MSGLTGDRRSGIGPSRSKAGAEAGSGLAVSLGSAVGAAVGGAMRSFREALRFGRPGASASRGGYDGGRRDVRDASWHPTAVGDNAAAEMDLPTVRARSRDASRNHELVRAGMRRLKTHAVGKGIRVRPATGSDALNEQIADRWAQHTGAVTPGGESSLFRLQGEAIEELYQAGDVLVVDSIVPEFNDRPAGAAIQLVRAERVPLDLEGSHSGNEVRQGVETDALGRVVAVWVHDSDPTDGGVLGFWKPATYAGGDLSGGVEGLTRIEASRCRLLGPTTGQRRGVPITVAGLWTSRANTRFKDAAIMQGIIATLLSGVVEDDSIDSGGLRDSEGNRVTQLAPGMVLHRRPGTKSEVNTPGVPGPAYAPTQQSIIQDLSAAIGLPYAMLTGDYSKTNFAGSKNARIDLELFLVELRDELWSRLVYPHYRRWLRAEILAGSITLPDDLAFAYGGGGPEGRRVLEAKPLMPATPWTDPRNEAAAEEIALRSGTMGPGMIAARHGTTVEEIADEWVAARRAFERHGIELPMPFGGGAGAAGDDGEAPDRDAPDVEREQTDDTNDTNENDRSALR